jgi:hypothetical protein
VTVTAPKEIRPGGDELVTLTGLVRTAASRCYTLRIVMSENITNVVLSSVMPLQA